MRKASSNVVMLKTLACGLVALLVAGCSTYSDERITRAEIAGSVFDQDVSHFCQHATYATNDSVYRGGAVLSHLLGFWKARDVSLVRFKSGSSDAFVVEYLDKDLGVVEAREFTRGKDYQIDPDGSVEIQTFSRCEGGGGPGIGCERSKVVIFNDQDGNLAVVQATSGAGVVGIVPVAGSSAYLSLFPPVASVGGSLQAGLAQCPISRQAQVAAEIQKHTVAPTFAVGDVVVPYRRFDGTMKTFVPGASDSVRGTRWRVEAITDQHVRLALIEGEYRISGRMGKTYHAGSFATEFSSSAAYLKDRPYAGKLGQIFEEFRKE